MYSETLQHNQNQCTLQKQNDNCLLTDFKHSGSEDYQRPLYMISYEILSNKGLKLVKFHWLQIPNTLTVHTSEFF
jgi:hypothetical protein